MSAADRLAAGSDDSAACALLADVLGASRLVRPTACGRMVAALTVDHSAGRVALVLSDGTGRLSTPRDRADWIGIAETLARLVRSAGVLVAVDPLRDLGVLAAQFHAHRVTRSPALPVTLAPLVCSAQSVGLADLGDQGDVWTLAETLLAAGAARARIPTARAA
ncbi:hypothetical protein [Rhodococcus sp. NPDC057529]|uniref:hypothetical protein n=1 Tax=Rhodococcus sp. NPDC057529 TaxID=3346158 RepID=UPI003671CDC8